MDDAKVDGWGAQPKQILRPDRVASPSAGSYGWETVMADGAVRAAPPGGRRPGSGDYGL
jgi:hypothetical protein